MARGDRSLRCALRVAFCIAWLRGSLPLPSSARCMFSYLLAIAFRPAYQELHERHGKTVRCAAAFCIARFLARCLRSDLPVLRSDYFFAQGMCSQPILGRVSRQVCALPRQRR